MNIMKRTIIFLLTKRFIFMMMCFVCVTAQAQTDWDDETEKTPEEEFRDNLKKAQAGNARAMFDVGESYISGKGVAKNIGETIKWWSKAADKGNVSALFNLAWLYSSERVGTLDVYKGKEIPKNPDEAFRLWKILGEQRETGGGMYYLGNCYWNGEGVARSYKEAVKWWQKAARKGQKDAREALKEIDEPW